MRDSPDEIHDHDDFEPTSNLLEETAIPNKILVTYVEHPPSNSQAKWMESSQMTSNYQMGPMVGEAYMEARIYNNGANDTA